MGVKTVVVLVSGRPLVVTDQMKKSDAFIAAWLPGSEGDGIAEVLFGDYNFKGKLPHSWPKSVEDFNGKYGPNFWNPSIEPLFSYGYGLKYFKETSAD
jgi:beta-glucosidase